MYYIVRLKNSYTVMWLICYFNCVQCKKSANLLFVVIGLCFVWHDDTSEKQPFSTSGSDIMSTAFTFQHVIVFKDWIIWFLLMMHWSIKHQSANRQMRSTERIWFLRLKIGYCMSQHKSVFPSPVSKVPCIRKPVINWNKETKRIT